MPPEKLGNRRVVLVSTQAGRSNVLAELERLGVEVSKDDPRVGRILDEVKEREALGYSYEGADASFYVLAQRLLGRVPEFFKVERFKVNVERRFNAKGELITFSEAIVKVRIGERSHISAAEGDGPVNALDKALRKDLGRYQAIIKGLKLTDFKVRIFQGGTDAVTRVLVDSTDETGESWTTVGVSANIIDASFQALTDSVTYKLMRAKEQARCRRSEGRGVLISIVGLFRCHSRRSGGSGGNPGKRGNRMKLVSCPLARASAGNDTDVFGLNPRNGCSCRCRDQLPLDQSRTHPQRRRSR